MYALSKLTMLEQQLKEALIVGNLMQAKLLIEKGADLNKPYFILQSTPLYYGAAHNYVDRMRLLLEYSEKINLDLINPVTGDTALHAACWRGCADNIVLLLQNGANANIPEKNTGYLPLHVYIYQGTRRVERFTLQRLIRATTNVNAVMQQDGLDGPAGVSAVHLATTQDNAVDILEELALSGQSLALNALDAQGHSPLHHAVWQEHEDAVAWLLDHGAQPNIASSKRSYNNSEHENAQWTPLHYAASQQNLGICQLLLRAGASPNCKTQSGLMARDLYVLPIKIQLESLRQYPASEGVQLLQQHQEDALQEFDDMVRKAQSKGKLAKK